MLLMFLSPNNSGIKQTSNGLIFVNPSSLIFSNGMYLSIKSNGHFPFSDSLNKLFICEHNKSKSFWVYGFKDIPLGITLLINSWLFSIDPFSKLEYGWQ